MSEPTVPIDTYILKVASQCNLNCTYCYVYNGGDESYRSQPSRMSPDIVSALLTRVADYCDQEKLRNVNFVFHGGEPLLAGRHFFQRFVATAKTILGDEIAPRYALQTNGTLLTAEWLDLFCELEIGFGISLDGPPAINDAYRVTRQGGGSYVDVKCALDMVLADRRLDGLFGGILTVVNLAANPIELYDHFRQLGIRQCDFLLPDATYDAPPMGPPLSRSRTPYADWLIAIFDVWFDTQDGAFSIRFFEKIVSLLFGPGFGNDALGGGKNGVLVVETDGGIEPVDVLKICGPSFTKLGLNVLRHEIRDACAEDLVRLYQEGAAHLCDRCLSCPVVAVCGGGYLPHRYRSVSGFDNPSVYCYDLMKLITHIRSRVLATIPDTTCEKLDLRPLSYGEALALLGDPMDFALAPSIDRGAGLFHGQAMAAETAGGDGDPPRHCTPVP